MILLCVRLIVMYASGNQLAATSCYDLRKQIIEGLTSVTPGRRRIDQVRFSLGTVYSFPETRFVKFCTTPQIEPAYVYY
jgi:hypothetical protein